MRIAVLIAVASSACGAGASSELDHVDPALFTFVPTYEANIRPMFKEYCVECHASDGPRLGGVELDRYETAYARRVHNACVSLTQPVIDRFAEVLVPLRIELSSGAPAAACKDLAEDGSLRPWPPYSMPKAALSGLTIEEQVILARWVATGARP